MKYLVIIFLLLSCGPEEKQKNQIAIEPPVSKEPKRIEYYPSTYLNLYKPFKIYEEEKPLIDDLMKYLEASYESKDKGVYHGHIPESFVNQKFDITWVDKTGGELDVKFKLMRVFDRINARCPGVTDTMLPLEVHVVKADKGVWTKNMAIYSSNSEIKYGSYQGKDDVILTLGGIKPVITIKGDHYTEDLSYFGQGNQTSLEEKGYYDWDVPVGKERPRWGIDNVFAHEVGHHFISSWIVKNGYHDLQSKFFGEYIADFFRGVCYGNIEESPRIQVWRSEYLLWHKAECRTLGLFCDEIDHYPYKYHGPREVVRHYMHPHYNPNLDEFIGNEKFLKRFDSAETWKAVQATLASMTGDKAGCFPYEKNPNEECMWQIVQDGQSNQEENKPLIWTKREFLQKFCDHYPCGHAEKFFQEQYQTYSENFLEW
ncbi:MAG: hypothetical protein AB8G05_27685 [Oligoflexales bacterium]